MIKFSVQGWGENEVMLQDLSTSKDMWLKCTIEQFNKGVLDYEKGALIQNAFPFLSPGEREFLLTGMNDEEFDNLFKEEE